METRLRQETTVTDITKVVETHAFNTVIQAENILELVADMIIEGKGTAHLRDTIYWKRLHAYCNGLIGCKSIAIVNPAGKIVALSETQAMPDIDVSDRAYFKVTQQTKQLFIGPAIVSRIKGRPILFSIAKPIYDASGKILAIVTVGVSTDHLTDFYGLMGFEVAPTVSVFKGNGDIVARHPDMKEHVGKNIATSALFKTHLPQASSGTYDSISTLDGKQRIAAYKLIKELDLVVFAGIETPLAFSAWEKRTKRTITIVGLVLVLILVILYFGYRSLSKQLVLKAENKKLGQLSFIDSLTGIANRRQFEMTWSRDWARHQREQTPLSVLLVDVDFFKSYNDNYGHQAGDACLRQVAQALQACLHRSIDLAARYGGEEFAIILHSNEEGARIVAERMRQAVESLEIKHAHSKVSSFVTISIGLASTSANQAQRPDELIKMADAALYQAKDQGRNTVASHASDANQPKLVA